MGSILKLFNGFSFKEKSILISLIAVAVLYGGYFYDLLASGAPEHKVVSCGTDPPVPRRAQ